MFVGVTLGSDTSVESWIKDLLTSPYSVINFCEYCSEEFYFSAY